jgi:hypothetical protein
MVGVLDVEQGPRSFQRWSSMSRSLCFVHAPPMPHILADTGGYRRTPSELFSFHINTLSRFFCRKGNAISHTIAAPQCSCFVPNRRRLGCTGQPYRGMFAATTGVRQHTTAPRDVSRGVISS